MATFDLDMNRLLRLEGNGERMDWRQFQGRTDGVNRRRGNWVKESQNPKHGKCDDHGRHC